MLDVKSISKCAIDDGLYHWRCNCGQAVIGNSRGMVARVAVDHLIERLQEFAYANEVVLAAARDQRALQQRANFRSL